MNKLTTTLVASAAVCLLHTSCDKKGEVQHFRTPKASSTASHPAAAPQPTGQAPAAPVKKATYTWTLPTGWTAQSASGMRLATITIPSANNQLSASITEFGGDVAGNVNRWRGQIGLPNLPEAEIPATLQEVETGLGKGYIVLITNPATPGKALLAAIIPRPTNTSVFIKLPGSISELQSLSESFTQFTQSLRQ